MDIADWIEHIFETVMEHFSPSPSLLTHPVIPTEDKIVTTNINGITVEQLKKIMPALSTIKTAVYLPFLNATMSEFEINSPLRMAAFIAQLAHESAQLRYFEEIASGEAYENRKDLGNVLPGDGKRYKGRGPIQLTGRANYRDAGKDLGLELEANPTMASSPEVGFRLAGWFWKRKALNALADGGEFKTITKKINGGFNGLEERIKFYTIAKDVLGAT